MSVSLNGRTALVTGSSRGIGQAIAERLAADSAAIIINYTRNEQPARAVVNRIVGNGGKAIAIQADISKAADVTRLFSDLRTRTVQRSVVPSVVIAISGFGSVRTGE